MPLIPYPNVPDVDGVPNVPQGPNTPDANYATDTTDPIELEQIDNVPAWGVFDDAGNQVLAPDTIQAFAFNNAYSISKFPIEKGSFTDINKVASPFESRVMMVKGGSDKERSDFLADVFDVLDSLDLFTIVTPECTFPNVNLVDMHYSKINRNGANMLSIDLQFEEIRLAPDAQYSEADASTTPVNADRTDSVNAPSARADGQVKATTPPSNVSAAGVQ